MIWFLSLFIPMIIEVWDDRKGEQHPSPDWKYRTVTTFLISFIVAWYNPVAGFFPDMIRCAVMIVGIYVFFFPYVINIVLYANGVIKNPKWYDHLSATAWPDRLEWWKGTPWFGRMFFMVWVFIVAAMIYFDPCSTIFAGLFCK